LAFRVWTNAKAFWKEGRNAEAVATYGSTSANLDETRFRELCTEIPLQGAASTVRFMDSAQFWQNGAIS
jgi:hypothetical protein